MLYEKIIACFFLTACGHLPADSYDNYIKHNYQNMEFDYKGNKYLGILPVTLKPNEPLDANVSFYGLYTGIIKFQSVGCALNYTQGFNLKTNIKLSQLMPLPQSCKINMTAITNPIKKLQHNIVEAGTIDVFVLPDDNSECLDSDISILSPFGNMQKKACGNISMQIPDGAFSSGNKINFNLSGSGQFIVNSTCSDSWQFATKQNKLSIPLNMLYGKNVTIDNKPQRIPESTLTVAKDNCDFYFAFVPEIGAKTFWGKLGVNVYSNRITFMEYAQFSSKKNILTASVGSEYALGVCINDKCGTDTVSLKTTTEGIYWIRALTSNGRKSVVGVKNNQAIWW